MTDEMNSSNGTSHALPSLQSLQAFERAATSGSFAMAADQLRRTPSAISHSIRDMEQRLGVTLFQRTGRSIRLTDAGAVYLKAVQSALQELQTATSLLVQSQNKDLVRLSALPFFTSAILLPNLPLFELTYPHLDLRIETSNAYADILNGEADAAIRFGNAHSGDLAVTPLATVFGQPAASPEYLASAPPLQIPEDLRAHTLIHVRQNTGAWREWYHAQTGEHLSAGRELVFDSILGALDAVKRGLGVGLSMHPLINTYPGFGTDFVPVFPGLLGPGSTYNFVCRKPINDRQSIQSTLKWLRGILADAASTGYTFSV